MKNIRLFIIYMLLAFAGNMQADNLSSQGVEVAPGGRAVVSVALENPATEYIMMEFWLSLPQGVSIPLDEDGYFLAEGNSTRFKRSHVIEVSKQEGYYHFLIYSSRNEAFKESAGELFNFTIEAEQGLAPGSYQGKIFNQLFNDMEKNEVTPEDVTFDIAVKGSAPTPGNADNLSVQDVNVTPGTEATVSVSLSNPGTEYIMVEFWLSLPQGFSIPTDADGYYMAEGNAERFKRTHILEVSEQEGFYHFLIYSSRNEAFKGNSGELFTFTLKAASDVAEGSYQGKIFNQLYNDTEKNEHSPEDVAFNINCLTDAITAPLAESADSPTYNIQGIRTPAPQRGIYIKNGKKYITK